VDKKVGTNGLLSIQEQLLITDYTTFSYAPLCSHIAWHFFHVFMLET